MKTRPQSVTSFTLINAGTDQTIAPIQDCDVIDLALIGTNKLNIEAFTNPPVVGSVKFDLYGNITKENKAPYAAGGNSGPNFRAITFAPGTYTVTATPFARRNFKGDEGASLTVTFTIINSGPAFRLEQDQLENALSVYPNPVSDFLVVELDAEHQRTATVTVSNLMGQVLVSQSAEGESGWATKLNLEQLPAGQYVLTVEGIDWQTSRTIVKE